MMMMMMMRMMGIGMLKTDTFLFAHSSNRGLDRKPKLEGTSYVYTFNVTSMLLDIVLFINVSIVMYIMTIK